MLRQDQAIQTTIPAGIDDGEMIRLPQQGEAQKGGVPGDLYVKVHVKPHPLFRKEGVNIVMDLPVKLTDALTGTTVTVQTIDEKELEVKIPAMRNTEEVLRVRGKGVVLSGGRGDLLIRASIVLPQKLSAKARRAVEDLKSEGL